MNDGTRPDRRRTRPGLRGHFWTVAPHVAHALRRYPLPPATPIGAAVDAPRLGVLPLGGDLRLEPDADTLLVLIHGLGGTPDSGYVRATARAAHARGWSTLCLAMRGADGTAADLYHSGLTDDLHAAVAAPAVAAHRRILVLGFSVGGHVALHFAHEQSGVVGSDRACRFEPRTNVAAIAAVCPPLDLTVARAHIDRPAARFYRWNVLRGLIGQYRQMASRRPVPHPAEAVAACRTLREWDALTVVPRFGFGDPDHYAASQSVAPYLERVTVPTLIVATDADPMVPGAVIRPFLPARNPAVDVRWLRRGGHLGAPRGVDLGFGPRRGLLDQVLGWLAAA